VKFLPVVLLPLYWKRVRIRDAALAAGVVGLLYVPFLDRSFFKHSVLRPGRIPIGSLGTYVQSFRFNGPVFAALDRVATPQLLAGLAVLVGLATATWLRIREPESSPDERTSTTEDTRLHRVNSVASPPGNSVSGACPERSRRVVQAFEFAWPMAASLLFAPVVFPWYLLWLLPFLTSASTLPIIVWTVSITPTYVMWHLRTLGRPWGALPVWVMVVEYGCVAAAAAIIGFRRFTRAIVRRISH